MDSIAGRITFILSRSLQPSRLAGSHAGEKIYTPFHLQHRIISGSPYFRDTTFLIETKSQTLKYAPTLRGRAFISPLPWLKNSE